MYPDSRELGPRPGCGSPAADRPITVLAADLSVYTARPLQLQLPGVVLACSRPTSYTGYMQKPADLLSAIKNYLSHRDDVQLAFVYGSAASGRLRPDSDVDLAVCGNAPFPVEQRIAIAADIEDIVCRPVDLLDLHTAEGLILYQAVVYGVVVKKHSGLWEYYVRKALYFHADLMPQITQSRTMKIQRFIDES